ncbi:MAG: ABC transporter permease [Anaerolineae bacterium]|nr:ABC transporter permease [Anaerolineae bacterium]
MNVGDLVSLVWSNLKRTRGRVTMTALGVAIGTAAVVVLISLGVGLQRQARESLMSGGGLTQLRVNAPVNYLTDVNDPSMPVGRELGAITWVVVDDQVLNTFRSWPGVTWVEPVEALMAQTTVEYGRLVGHPTICGVDEAALPAWDLAPASGTLDMRRGEAVVGARVAASLRKANPSTRPVRPDATPETPEDAPDLQGATLRLRMTRFTEDGEAVERTVRLRVVGVLRESGWRHDGTIYIPMRDALEYTTWAQGKRREPGRQGYLEVVIGTDDPASLIEVEDKVTAMGFSVWSDRQQAEQANAYFASLQAVLGGIGAVALLVAAFGIANTMLMAVYERTREIGLMKAVGAGNRDVMRIFLAESAGIGLLGGAAGVCLALLVVGIINLINRAVVAQQVAQGAMVDPSQAAAFTPLWLPLFAVGFAALVGVLSGAYPARRAARLSPIGALKYE